MYHSDHVMHVKFGQAGLGKALMHANFHQTGLSIAQVIALELIEIS